MRPHSSFRQARVARPAFIALFVLLLVACSDSNSSQETVVLLDTSGSTPSQAFARAIKSAEEDAARWSTNASSRDVFTLAWLEGEGSPYPVGYRSWLFPRLEIPANRHRSLVADRIARDIEITVASVATGIQHTKLLEAFCYLASTRSSSDWTVIVYSDFVQDSNDFNRAELDLEDDPRSLITEMMRICPPAEHPPKAITLVAYPGRISSSEDIHYYQRIRELFALFASSWSTSSKVNVRGLR